MTASPSDFQPIAERLLKAHSKSSGEELALKVMVGTPYWAEEGLRAACPVSIEGLHGRIRDISGIDPLDALRNAIKVVDQLIAGVIEDHELFWPDGEPFELEKPA